MKKTERKIRKLILLTGFVVIYACFVATAWATVSFVTPQSEVQDIEISNNDQAAIENSTSDSEKPKSRAPEPATLALFGSGFFSMILSFIKKTYAAIKRVLDVAASIVGLIVLSPVLLVLALLVRLTSRGPIIYSQIRSGKDGVPFKMYKFRTMKVDAEKETGPVWASLNDSRLTPIGGFLRKAHLDELPQLINVLKGEMSVIGPRPERPMFVDKFKNEIQDYEKRLTVKPGITGLAQVWHRYDETIEDVKKKVKYDLLYIKKMCLWSDVRIVLRTFRVVFTGEGAR